MACMSTARAGWDCSVCAMHNFCTADCPSESCIAIEMLMLPKHCGNSHWSFGPHVVQYRAEASAWTGQALAASSHKRNATPVLCRSAIASTVLFSLELLFLHICFYKQAHNFVRREYFQNNATVDWIADGETLLTHSSIYTTSWKSTSKQESKGDFRQ
jgi:hypothetical protein